MEEEMCEMHSEDDKALLEKNKKRMVKTRAQVEALEKFYNEHKYPTETMKIELAESIGLTEKQVSGWFCHRRLKDKRLKNGENQGTGKQERSSGVIQDRGSGHRQDSCGSTKQGDDRNFDTKEVESGKVTLREYSAAELTYDRVGHYVRNHHRIDDASSGSSSSLRNMSNSNTHVGDLDVANSRYPVPKFPADLKGVKPRPGPSGYLKVKGQVENAAITAVKRQLGKHYREDGPPLGVEFDPLPPGAFESSMQDPVDETYYAEEAALPASPDVPKVHLHPKFNKGSEFNSTVVPRGIDRTNLKMTEGSDIPNSYAHQKFRKNTSLPNHGAYFPRRNSVELPEDSARDMSGSEIRDDYRARHRQGFEAPGIDSVPNHRQLQPYGGKVREERETRFDKYNDVGIKISHGEKIKNGSSSLSTKGYQYHNSLDEVLPREATKVGKAYAERRMLIENRIRSPFENDTSAPKRMRGEFPQLQHPKRQLKIDNQREPYLVARPAAEMPCTYSEDDESAETSSSVD